MNRYTYTQSATLACPIMEPADWTDKYVSWSLPNKDANTLVPTHGCRSGSVQFTRFESTTAAASCHISIGAYKDGVWIGWALNAFSVVAISVGSATATAHFAVPAGTTHIRVFATRFADATAVDCAGGVLNLSTELLHDEMESTLDGQSTSHTAAHYIGSMNRLGRSNHRYAYMVYNSHASTAVSAQIYGKWRLGLPERPVYRTTVNAAIATSLAANADTDLIAASTVPWDCLDVYQTTAAAVTDVFYRVSEVREY